MGDLGRYLIHARTDAFLRRRQQTLDVLQGLDHRTVLVSSSFGKDSLAMMSVAVEALCRLNIVHLRSAYSIPIEYRVVSQWTNAGHNVEFVDGASLEEVIETMREVGLPHERTKSQQQRYVQRRKKTPLVDFAREHGYDTVLLGLRASESNSRLWNYRVRGHTYVSQSGIRTCTPIAHWSHADVWAEIASRHVFYPSLYDCETHGFTRETIRNSGWLSTDLASRGRLAWLHAHWPDLYARLKRAFPQCSIMGS